MNDDELLPLLVSGLRLCDLVFADGRASRDKLDALAGAWLFALRPLLTNSSPEAVRAAFSRILRQNSAFPLPRDLAANLPRPKAPEPANSRASPGLGKIVAAALKGDPEAKRILAQKQKPKGNWLNLFEK